MKKNKRDSLVGELAIKYGRPYKEIRKEVCRQISIHQNKLGDTSKLKPIEKSKAEEESIINYFIKIYGN